MKAIIFDLQGTLVENGVFPSPLRQVKNILRIRQDFHEFVPMFERIFMTRKYETLMQAFREVAKAFELDTPDFILEKLVGLWNKNKLLSRMFLDTEDTLSTLQKNYQLILVANIDCFSRELVDRFKLNDYFDKMYLSCDTGLLKNDEEFYSTILEENGLSKDDVVIVGDSIESDMKSAKNFGIKGILIDRNNRMEYDPRILGLEELKVKLDE